MITRRALLFTSMLYILPFINGYVALWAGSVPKPLILVTTYFSFLGHIIPMQPAYNIRAALPTMAASCFSTPRICIISHSYPSTHTCAYTYRAPQRWLICRMFFYSTITSVAVHKASVSLRNRGSISVYSARLRQYQDVIMHDIVVQPSIRFQNVCLYHCLN